MATFLVYSLCMIIQCTYMLQLGPVLCSGSASLGMARCSTAGSLSSTSPWPVAAYNWLLVTGCEKVHWGVHFTAEQIVNLLGSLDVSIKPFLPVFRLQLQVSFACVVHCYNAANFIREADLTKLHFLASSTWSKMGLFHFERQARVFLVYSCEYSCPLIAFEKSITIKTLCVAIYICVLTVCCEANFKCSHLITNEDQIPLLCRIGTQ